MEGMAQALREALGECPILFTCRTEDGQFSMDSGLYTDLNKRMIRTGNIDLMDVELSMGEQVCRELSEYAHAHHVITVISNHEFRQTPDTDVMIQRLHTMRCLGADIPKLAVMPTRPLDVLKLLQATDTYNQWYGDCPLITMSMGKLGEISRLCGETFGSVLTFAAVDNTSAPGQFTIEDTRFVLNILHE